MTFSGRYAGTCEGCDEPIEPGESVRYVDEVVVHAGCSPTGRRRGGTVKKEVVCTGCWLMKPCPCEVEQ